MISHLPSDASVPGVSYAAALASTRSVSRAGDWPPQLSRLGKQTYLGFAWVLADIGG
jgi:hypothetical protein